MPQDIQPRVVQQVTTPEPFTPPSARETRAQALHRLQVGLFGLCAMLLLVGLANIIMDRARLADEDNPAAEVIEPTESAQPATDPLADIGVVPAADPSAASGPGKGP
jgi:hypothetical protein